MAENAFELIYEGSALQEGRMPIADLAPALVALEALSSGISYALHPDAPTVVLSISSTQQGSFIVHLVVESSLSFDQVIDVFSSDTADAVSNIVEFVLLLKLFFELAKRRGADLLGDAPDGLPDIQELMAGSGSQQFPQLASLTTRPNLVRNARDVVAPLQSDGIDEMRLEGGGSPTVIVSKDHVPYFDALVDEAGEFEDHDSTLLLRIVSLSLNKGTSWRFSDGQTTFPAPIVDEEFVERVRLGSEVFRNGDVLRCRLRVSQRVDENGKLKTKRTVVEVLEHRRAEQHATPSLEL